MMNSLIFRSLSPPSVEPDLDPLSEGHTADRAERLELTSQGVRNTNIEMDMILIGIRF
jgi:hypothetical protein